MRLAPSRPVTAVAEDGRAGRAPVPSSAGAPPAPANGSAGARDGATGGSARAKSGAHREAALYHALARRGAADGRSLGELREAALEAAAAAELPVWRRSGFWTTSFESLDFDALAGGADAGAPTAVPEIVERTLPERTRAGRIVQADGGVVSLELAPELATRGVILCSLEDAFAEHAELVRCIDRAATRGALHRNTAARKKAQAARLVSGPPA